jgi:protein BUR2
VAQKNPVLIVDEQTKDYWRWKDTITQNEDVMLELLCFDLTIESPYKALYEMMQSQGVVHHKVLRDTAWSFLNDSGMTQLCLLFPTRTIACAALYCGAKIGEVHFDDDKNGRPWWEKYNVVGRDLRRAYNHMAVAFRDAPLKPGQKPIYLGELEDLDADERFAKTRTLREDAPLSPEAEGLLEIESPRKRAREEESIGNGGHMVKSLGLPSRIPAAALAVKEDRAAKRIKTEEPEDLHATSQSTNGRQVSPALSEDGEVEE